jgi:EAL domain-containing protein (putative c-di-GMP-specific phosphodiesterase class I)
MQGYYFSKPVDFEEIVVLLQQQQAESNNTRRLDSAV